MPFFWLFVVVIWLNIEFLSRQTTIYAFLSFLANITCYWEGLEGY
jgi:hypothetical protein